MQSDQAAEDAKERVRMEEEVRSRNEVKRRAHVTREEGANS